MAYKKQYIAKEKLSCFIENYEKCSKMLYGLEQSLAKKNIKNNLNLKS